MKYLIVLLFIYSTNSFSEPGELDGKGLSCIINQKQKWSEGAFYNEFAIIFKGYHGYLWKIKIKKNSTKLEKLKMWNYGADNSFIYLGSKLGMINRKSLEISMSYNLDGIKTETELSAKCKVVKVRKLKKFIKKKTKEVGLIIEEKFKKAREGNKI